MNGIYLCLIVLGVALQNIFKKVFGEKTKGKGSVIFGALCSFVAMLFFVAVSGGFGWDKGILPYAIGFAISYATATVASTIAVNIGSLSLTALLVSFSLMVPTFYGLFFRGEEVSIGLIPGLVLLSVSLILVNTKNEEIKISCKWIVAVLLAFVGNGMCSTVQKMQQVAFSDAYKNEFMIIALAITTVSLLVFSFFFEHKDLKLCVKKGIFLALFCGAANGIVNLLVMLLNSKNFPASLMFPIISAGGIIVTYFVSKYFYKEQLTKTQLIGFVSGVCAVICLNI